MRPEGLNKLLKTIRETDPLIEKRKVDFFESDLYELQSLLQSLHISNYVPDMKYGKFWTVSADTFPGSDVDRMNVRLSVRTRDPDKQVLAEGLSMVLQSDEGSLWLSRGVTEPCGDVWFKDVPLCLFRAGTDISELLELLTVSERTEKMAAAEDENRIVTIFVDDQNLYIRLLAGDDGKAILSVRANDTKYENALIFFKIRAESGSLILKPIESGSYCIASQQLTQSFNSIKGCLPQIRVVTKTGE